MASPLPKPAGPGALTAGEEPGAGARLEVGRSELALHPPPSSKNADTEAARQTEFTSFDGFMSIFLESPSP